MPTNNETSSEFRLVLTPDKAAIAADAPTTLRVLVRVQAPDLPANASARAPLHLALVLDRSGSMNGVPLEEARRCARNIIDSLAHGDRAAIFAFDDEIERIAPLTPAADRLSLATALAGIQSGGMTNLHGGWQAGAEELAAQLAGDDVHRVILLSDGGANAGETGLEEIARQCKVFARRGVSTSTYGLGEQFNEPLMLAMAAAGRGNAYYGQTAADLAEPFAAEFALLASLCARGLVLKVNAPAGSGSRFGTITSRRRARLRHGSSRISRSRPRRGRCWSSRSRRPMAAARRRRRCRSRCRCRRPCGTARRSS